MNSYIHAQILNMIAITKTFEQSCEIGTLQDDGSRSREEEKELRKIKAATEHYRKQLESIR